MPAYHYSPAVVPAAPVVDPVYQYNYEDEEEDHSPHISYSVPSSYSYGLADGEVEQADEPATPSYHYDHVDVHDKPPAYHYNFSDDEEDSSPVNDYSFPFYEPVDVPALPVLHYESDDVPANSAYYHNYSYDEVEESSPINSIYSYGIPAVDEVDQVYEPDIPVYPIDPVNVQASPYQYNFSDEEEDEDLAATNNFSYSYNN